MRARYLKLLHFLAGILTILQGLDRLEMDHKHPLFFILTGALLGSFGLLNDKYLKNRAVVISVFYWMEALMLLFIAFHYFDLDKKYLPFIYAGLAVYYVVVGYQVLHLKSRKK